VPVLVDECGAGGVSSDRCSGLDHGFLSVVVGCTLVQASVGSVLVVMLYEVLEESAELALVPYQGPVEEFVADGADPSLSECVGLWSAGRDGYDRPTAGGEDVVE